MILKSIRLKNIRSYQEQLMVFPEGSTLLAGDIGSGKSSILHSIEFALFGARRDSISGDALLRKGEHEGEVELNFELEGRPVTIKRKLKRQRDSVAQDAGFIVIDGKKVEGTATELKARLLDLLGYPKELLTKSNSLVYRYTVYTPQEEMKSILLESAELRIDTLRKVFGIDRYKRISENATIYVRNIKEQKRELLGQVHGLDEKEADIKARKNSLGKKEMERGNLLPMLEQIRKRKDSKKEELEEVEQGIKELNELKKQNEVCDARLMEIVKTRANNRSEMENTELQMAQIKKRLEDTFLEDKNFPDTEEVEKDIAEKERCISEVSSRKTTLSERKKNIHERAEQLAADHEIKSQKAGLSAAKESLYNELLEELKDKKTITDSIEDVNKRVKGLDEMISGLNMKKKDSETLKQDISSLDNCPTCKQQVRQEHKQNIIDEEDVKLKSITAELGGLISQKQEISAKLDAYNRKLEILNEKERRLAAIRVEVDNLKTIKEELDKIRESRAALDREKESIITELEKLDDSILNRMNSELEEKKALLKEIHRYNLLLKEKKHNLAMLAEKETRKVDLTKLQEQLKEEVRKINADKMRVNEQIVGMSGVEELFRSKKEEFDAIVYEEKKMEVRIGEVNKEIEGINALISALQKDIAVKMGAKAKIDRLNSVQEWLEKMFINLMSTMERQIMAKVHNQFSGLFSTWFNLLIEDENISVLIDDTFSPVIAQNGYETQLTHLSGGEKTSVALAYRLALNRVINDMISEIKTRNIIMLDEPTDGFSSEQLDKVRNVLDELNVKQTIIVSHESKIESFVDNVIRIHKSEHVSRVV